MSASQSRAHCSADDGQGLSGRTDAKEVIGGGWDGSGQHKTDVIGGGLDGCGEHASRDGRGARVFLSWCIFPCAALACCFGPPPRSVWARSVFLALVIAWLSWILSWGGGVGDS